MTEPKVQKRKMIRYQYFYVCPVCKKEIKGTSIEHLEANWYYHIDKHKRKKEAGKDNDREEA